MGTKKITVNSSEWVKVTSGESSGSYLAIGSGDAYITQQASKPSGEAGSAAIMDIVSSSSPRPFFDIPSGEFLWARTQSGELSLHVTNGG